MSVTRSNNNKKEDFDNGHWSFHAEMDPHKYFGFTYLIRCRKTGKSYIGRKQYKHAGKKSSRNYNKEMAWRTYEGSSIHLAAHIRKVKPANIDFICLGEYSCRGDLVYAEVHEQVTRDVLRARQDNGERLYFNGQISAIKFIPPCKETRKNEDL